MGTVKSLKKAAGGRALVLRVSLGRHARGLRTGQSVALNGACLTAVGISGGECTFELVEETARLTALGSLAPGDRVNVERSLRAGARLEGHFVLGHVDGTARITSIRPMDGETRLSLSLPAPLARHVVKKGSIAVDGISLTVTSVRGRTATVALIPHTLRVTNLGSRREGDVVNVETDVLAKYATLPKK